MKKYLVVVVKLFIGVSPKMLREFLKKSPRLTAYYTKSLRDVGILNALPNQKKQDDLYCTNIKTQNRYINQFGDNRIAAPILLVCVYKADHKCLKATINSIFRLSEPFHSVLFYCPQSKFSSTQKLLKKVWPSFTDNCLMTKLDANLSLEINNQSCFVIYEGDRLHQDSCKALNTLIKKDTTLAYVDCDKINEELRRHSPEFYPDWNPDLHLSTGYVQSGVWFSNIKMLVESKFHCRFSGTAEWFVEHYLSKRAKVIQHIPLVLLHRPEDLPNVFKESEGNIEKQLLQLGVAEVKLRDKVLCLNWEQAISPLVSLIIPTKNGKQLVQACVESILEKSTYKNFEILLVDNNSDEQESILYFEELALHPQIRVLSFPHEFNYSAINNFAAKYAEGEILGLVNNDIEVIEPNWLSSMVWHVMRDDIGCVGAKLLYADGKVQHAGVVMGFGGGAGHAHKYFPGDHPGYLNRLSATQNFSAVTAACLLVKKADFEAVGGLNETDLKIAFNDVDFCLRIIALGRRNLYCAEAVLYHHESISRGLEDTVEKRERFDSEVAYLQKQWDNYIQHDPAYNPNLTLRYENFTIKE